MCPVSAVSVSASHAGEPGWVSTHTSAAVSVSVVLESGVWPGTHSHAGAVSVSHAGYPLTPPPDLMAYTRMVHPDRLKLRARERMDPRA